MSTEVKPTDWDAEDNRWEPTPSGGGSGLPEVTSSDEGKVLAVNASGEWAASSNGALTASFEMPILTFNASYNDIISMLENGIIPHYYDADGRFTSGMPTLWIVVQHFEDDGGYYVAMHTSNDGSVDTAIRGDSATSNLYFDFG